MNKKSKLYVVDFERDSPESISKAFTILSSDDNDFNGKNGYDYLWKDAKEKGFENNLEYLTDKVKDYPFISAVNVFLKEWLSSSSFYTDYEYVISVSGNRVFLAVMIMTA